MSIPGSLTPLFNSGSSAAAGPVQIERSLRFNSSDSGFCSRAVTSTGNRTTFTLSLWVKRSSFNTYQRFFSSLASGRQMLLRFNNDNTLLFEDSVTASSFATSQVCRDPSAWAHIVLAIDTTQATSSNRIKVYFNGTQITTFASTAYPTQNSNTSVNLSGDTMYLGGDTTGEYFNGYLADIHFIDGQALTPSSFTEVSATTGQLIPKTYTGTFGTNGFWLKFSDNSAATAAALGNDYSGNNNDWTPNNLSVTAGAGNDSLVDTPTSYGTDTGVGGEVRGNYCTLNPLIDRWNIGTSGTKTFADGNLKITATTGDSTRSRYLFGTIGVSSGKWYYEMTVDDITGGLSVGFAPRKFADDDYTYQIRYNSNGSITINGSTYSSLSTYTTGDIIGIALDLNGNTVQFYKNNTAIGSSYSITGGIEYLPFLLIPLITTSSTAATFNFGQRAFAYTAPSGFKALCDTNLPAPLTAKPNTVFDVALWTGTGVARSITGLAFSPDLIWIKQRSGSATAHSLEDIVRGTNKHLASSATDAEVDVNAYGGGVTAFNSSGFSLGTWGAVNENNQTYVGWTWDGGTSTVSNTSGSITSQVRANASAGFSVITWTGAGTINATVGHGLGVAPKLRITKNRTTGGTGWPVHTTVIDGSLDYLFLNSTAAKGDSSENIDTSTVFSVFNTTDYGDSGQNFVTYAFAPVVGYSSFGSYVGNGSSDGVFVYTGFRVKWYLVKQSSASGENWRIIDATRSPYNVAQDRLLANTSAAEGVQPNEVDFLSNGFKFRSADSAYNGSGSTYIYAAFAENPFQYSRAR